MKTVQKAAYIVTRRDTDTDSYDVLSPSGKTYIVSFCGSGDGDPEYVALWDCTCPAAKYGRGRCKHMNVVIRATDEREPELEIGESVEIE